MTTSGDAERSTLESASDGTTRDQPIDFVTWYRAEHPRVLATITALAPSFAEASDITDEAFARALARWHRVGTMATPGGWVCRVAVNELRRRHRRVFRREALEPLDDLPVTAAGDERLLIIEALRALPPRERTIVALRFVADLPEREVAERLGIRPGTVSAAVHSARRRLTGDPPTERNTTPAPVRGEQA